MSIPQNIGSKSLTILLVGHEPHELLILKEILQRYHFRLQIAHDSEQALTQVQLELPDLIVMNIEMPTVDGLTVCKILKTQQKIRRIPVILLSSQQGLLSKLRGLEVGCADYITRPFYPEEVVARIALRLDHAEIISQLAATKSSSLLKTSRHNNQIASCQLVFKACNLLNKNIQNPPSIEQLARQLQTNRNYLNKAFQKHLGVPPFTWLREERLRQARNLLKETSQPLKLVSYQCGYKTPASFITSFKSRFGITPSAYRQTAVNINRIRGGVST